MPPQDQWEQYATPAQGAAPPPQGDEWEKYASGGGESTPPEPSTTQKVISGAKDVGVGALKGLGHTLGGLSPLINKIPYVGETLAPSEGIKAWQSITEPKGTAQKVGYGGEQAAEFLLPSGAEEKGAAALAEHLPALGKIAAPTARTAIGALSTGAVNKLQGGSFSGGAAMGGGMGAVGEVGKAVAPSIAESALGITKKMRGFGKTPGTAALEETGHAIRPGTIADKAQEKLHDLTAQLERHAAASTVTASTKPAIGVVDKAQIKAINQNDRSTYQTLHDLREQLTREFSTGDPIPRDISASKILDLKRGIGSLEKTWNPEVRSGIKPVIRKVYNALDKELDNSVPESAKLNQRISSLIPVAQRAESTELGAGISQRLAHRVAAHTGALAGAGIGGGIGYQRGGTPGAIIGGMTGLVAPEILASPTVQMAAAKSLASPIAPAIARASGSQLLSRKKNPDEE